RTAPDGTRSLVVDLDDAPGVEGYLEVWLLKPDVSGLVSLGTLDGTSGTFALPADLDLTQFPVVDVSDEPMDGDPAHSGVSVVRGALDV
ncbi:anti-sigma factor, partial [Cellulomonas iranensis]